MDRILPANGVFLDPLCGYLKLTGGSGCNQIVSTY